MGLFGDKLLLRLAAEQTYSGDFDIHILKIEKSINYLLPFSCISLINSQVTILSEYNRKSLCKSIIDFIESPKLINRNARLVSKFVLELYRKNKYVIYNQFQPITYGQISPSLNSVFEKSVIALLMDYTSKVYQESRQPDRNKIRGFLLFSIVFFQKELLPIIRRIDVTNIRDRKKLALDHRNFSSSIYNRWNSKIPFLPGSSQFDQHLHSVTKFDDYIK